MVSDCEELVGAITGDDWGYYVTLKWKFVRFEERAIWFKVIYFYLVQIYNNN